MLAIAVNFWQYIVGKKNKKAKFCYLQYETTVTTAETSSRGQHRLICDMVLLTSSAGCPHCTPAHSTPWEGSGNRFTARIFHPAPSEKALKYRKCFWPSGSVPLDGEAASQQESRCSSATRERGQFYLKKKNKKNGHVEWNHGWAAHLMLVDMFHQLATLQTRPSSLPLYSNEQSRRKG